MTIRLLGPPAIERDGRPAPSPRGRKAWALLCYVLLAERPPGRKHLAELLFGEADDPLGALRAEERPEVHAAVDKDGAGMGRGFQARSVVRALR